MHIGLVDTLVAYVRTSSPQFLHFLLLFLGGSTLDVWRVWWDLTLPSSFACFFVRFQDMIPMPPAAADSGLELLLTNLWVGKGERPRRCGVVFSFVSRGIFTYTVWF